MFNPDEEKYLVSQGCGNEDCSRKWICKDGRVMTIQEMEDTHLINSMLKIQRDWPWRKSYYHCIVQEAKKRGLI